jgi:hypothetical protein
MLKAKNNFWIHENLFKTSFTLLHFAMDDPVMLKFRWFFWVWENLEVCFWDLQTLTHSNKANNLHIFKTFSSRVLEVWTIYPSFSFNRPKASKCCSTCSLSNCTDYFLWNIVIKIKQTIIHKLDQLVKQFFCVVLGSTCRRNFSAIFYIAVRIHVMFDYMNHNIAVHNKIWNAYFADFAEFLKN